MSRACKKGKRRHFEPDVLIAFVLTSSLLNPRALTLDKVLQGRDEDELTLVIKALERRSQAGETPATTKVVVPSASRLVTETDLAKALEQSSQDTLQMVNKKLKMSEAIRRAKHRLTHPPFVAPASLSSPHLSSPTHLNSPSVISTSPMISASPMISNSSPTGPLAQYQVVQSHSRWPSMTGGTSLHVQQRVAAPPLNLGTTINRETFMRGGKKVTRTTTRTRRLISSPMFVNNINVNLGTQ